MKRLIRKSVESLTGYVPGDQSSAKGVIKLNTNENPYPPCPGVSRIFLELDARRLRLYPDPVCAKLRDKIAAVHGSRVSRVFVGNGSDEVLALCTRAFVENDGYTGYFNPSYSLYPVLADIRNVGKRPVELGADFEWPLNLPENRQTPDKYGCSLFFVTSPNSPTGMLYPKTKLRDFCRRFAGVVVIDEAYVDFARETCMEIAVELDNVLIVRTLSKGYSLAGLRIGYALGSDRLIEALCKVKDSYNVNCVSQEVGVAALSDMEYMRRNVARIKATRGRLNRALADIGYTVYPSEANFLWVKPRGMSAGELFESLRRQGILVRHFPGARTGDFVRISVGTDRETDMLIDAVMNKEEMQ